MNRSRFAIFLVASLALAGCGNSDAKEGRGERPAPLVKVEPATSMRFVERIEAVGTARANEQVTLSAPVTERIVRLAFDDGAYVQAGQTIAVLASGQEAAQLSEAQARARETSRQLERVQTLKQRGFATNANLDTQVAAAASARAQAAEARASIGDRVITAPFGGWVSLRTISAGAVVSAGTEIATISDLSAIKLDFPVPETALAAIRPGQTIVARASAYPDREFRGQIANIDPVIDPNTRAVLVRAVLPNPDRALKPGMLMTVDIETAPRLGVSVPELAVIGEGDQRFVYVLGEGDTAERVPVRTGLRSGGRIEVLAGLRPGQRVITEGIVKVSDDMKVRVAGAQNATRGARQAPATAAPGKAAP